MFVHKSHNLHTSLNKNLRHYYNAILLILIFFLIRLNMTSGTSVVYFLLVDSALYNIKSFRVLQVYRKYVIDKNVHVDTHKQFWAFYYYEANVRESIHSNVWFYQRMLLYRNTWVGPTIFCHTFESVVLVNTYYRLFIYLTSLICIDRRIDDVCKVYSLCSGALTKLGLL